MRVRLTRRITSGSDGVDLSNLEVGEVVNLPARKARALIAAAAASAVVERRTDGPPSVIAFRRRTDLGHQGEDDEASRVERNSSRRR